MFLLILICWALAFWGYACVQNLGCELYQAKRLGMVSSYNVLCMPANSPFSYRGLSLLLINPNTCLRRTGEWRWSLYVHTHSFFIKWTIKWSLSSCKLPPEQGNCVRALLPHWDTALAKGLHWSLSVLPLWLPGALLQIPLRVSQSFDGETPLESSLRSTSWLSRFTLQINGSYSERSQTTHGCSRSSVRP